MRAKALGALFVLAAAVVAVAVASRQGEAQQGPGALQAPPVNTPCTVYIRPHWLGQSATITQIGELNQPGLQVSGIFRGMDAEWVVLGHEQAEGEDKAPPDHWIPREAVLFLRAQAPEL